MTTSKLHTYISLSLSLSLSLSPQLSLQEKSHNVIRDVLSEIGVYQKIRHENIVRLQGVEVQHVSECPAAPAHVINQFPYTTE